MFDYKLHIRIPPEHIQTHLAAPYQHQQPFIAVLNRIFLTSTGRMVPEQGESFLLSVYMKLP